MNKSISVFLMVLLLSSCSAFMNDSNSKANISSSLVDFLYSDPEEAKEHKLEIPLLKLPVNIGIAFIPSNTSFNNPLSLSAKNKYDLLLTVKNEFIKHDYINRIEIIPDTYLKNGNGFETLEQVSRLYDVDIMALVSYDQVTQNNENNASILYWTIAGLYLIPGNDNSTQTFVDTAVFDIKSRKMLLRAPGVNKINSISTAVGLNETIAENSEKGFDRAVLDMIGNLNSELDIFKGRVKNESIAKVESREGYSGGSIGIWLVLFLLASCLFRLRFKRG